MTRYIALNVPDVMDYKKLPAREIHSNSANAFIFKEMGVTNNTCVSSLKFQGRSIDNLDAFLSESGTTAFIIIRNDSLLMEKYYQGQSRTTPVKTFSVSKSVIATLIGIAMDEGYIKSADDRVMQYIPEIREKKFRDLTIGQCLSLTTGLRSDEGSIFPWNDKVRVYYSRDIRGLLKNIKYRYEPGKVFQMEEITPMLLGLILERATGKSISNYLEDKIWNPAGMENHALWVIDSKKKGFEVVNSGLVATPLDMARFGRLYLGLGGNNEPVLPEDWIETSTQPDTTSVSFWRNIQAYQGSDVYYRYTWWGLRDKKGSCVFSANGHFGQRVFIIPSKQLMILRFGSDDGGIDWTAFIQEMALHY